VEANSTGGQGSRRAVSPSDDDDDDIYGTLLHMSHAVGVSHTLVAVVTIVAGFSVPNALRQKKKLSTGPWFSDAFSIRYALRQKNLKSSI
jgi:hypothetical protein